MMYTLTTQFDRTEIEGVDPVNELLTGPTLSLDEIKKLHYPAWAPNEITEQPDWLLILVVGFGLYFFMVN